MKILYALNPPDWKINIPPANLENLDPGDLFGAPITWTYEESPTPVFIKQFEIRGRDIYLLGIKYDTTKMLLNGRSGSVGFILQYIVIEFVSKDYPVIHILRQHRTPIYSVIPEGKDWLWASDLEGLKSNIKYAPKWEESEAQWPTSRGNPMEFVGQVSLPDNSVTRSNLSWDKNLYLFCAEKLGKSVFKLFAQDVGLQTAEDHYYQEGL
jgi:hypothetical protein